MRGQTDASHAKSRQKSCGELSETLASPSMAAARMMRFRNIAYAQRRRKTDFRLAICTFVTFVVGVITWKSPLAAECFVLWLCQ